MIVWLSTPFKFPLSGMALDPNQGKSDSQHSELTDRDSAAEEVRAVAAKISNIEQMIADGQDYARSERERMREEFRSVIEQERIDGKSQQDSQLLQSMEQSVLALSTRIDNLDRRSLSQQSLAASGLTEPAAAFTWHESVDALSFADAQVPYSQPQGGFEASWLQSQNLPALSTNGIAGESTPYYTIPPTTTLLNGTALTALVGRIPIQGRLEDPWRFKIITGADNLAANGHRIPQISGMLWSGTARGDFALSCVSGHVDTAAYIFTDGTIRTVRTQVQSENPSAALGWISDERGNPCIGGDLKTNALQFLAQSTLVNSATATAQAFANSQTTTSTNSATGESAESLTGSIDDYIAGRATEEAFSQISQWLNDRRQNSFDAVYVPAGQLVAIHIETPIQIDYELNGRRVDHFSNANANTHLGWLD